MMGRGDRLGFRMAALIALLALALGAAACGDDDDGDSGDSGAAAQSQTESQDRLDPASFDTSTPEGQIKAAHAEFINVFYTMDAKRICELTSRKGQREWRGKTGSCEAGVKAFFDGIQGLAKNKPRITEVRIDGSRALAKTRVKGSKVYPAPFVKEDGEWKVDGGGSDL